MGEDRLIEQAYKKGFLEGIRLMEQRMILAAENGTPINIGGRAYFIQDDMDHLKEIFAKIGKETNSVTEEDV